MSNNSNSCKWLQVQIPQQSLSSCSLLWTCLAQDDETGEAIAHLTPKTTTKKILLQNSIWEQSSQFFASAFGHETFQSRGGTWPVGVHCGQMLPEVWLSGTGVRGVHRGRGWCFVLHPSAGQPPLPAACFSGLVWFGFAKHCCFRFLYNSGACVQKGQLQVKPGSFIFFSNLVCRQALSCRDKAKLGILKKMMENVRNNYWISAFGSLLFMWASLMCCKCGLNAQHPWREYNNIPHLDQSGFIKSIIKMSWQD